MRAATVWTAIKTIGGLTPAISFYEELVGQLVYDAICLKPFSGEIWAAAEATYEDLKYIYARHDQTGHPISYEFVNLCLTEEAAPRGLSALKESGKTQ